MPPQKPGKPSRRGPHIQRSSTPRRPSIESIYKGNWMRSRLEVEFAKHLDACGIAWAYEPERLQGGRYLVDFHLPELRCWIEVKGRFEARDHLLLPLVAGHLDGQRRERLFLYMRGRAFHVTDQGFTALSHDEFWRAIREVSDDEALDYLREKRLREAGTPDAPNDAQPPDRSSDQQNDQANDDSQ
jgi:hypothetical protein